ncbi:glycosyltransferase [Candidatus Woesearchaeota archaeon]|nr:glycosyltransferase [Candidatus Woesearchaeota archaeon]
MRKIKVCHVFAHELNPAGSEKRALKIATNLAKKKFDSYLCAFGNNGLVYNKSSKVHLIKPTPSKLLNMLEFYKIIKLIPYFKKNKFDIVHAFCVDGNFAGTIAAKVAKIPIIINSHVSMIGSYKENSRLYHKLYGYILRNLVTKHIAVSKTVKKDYILNKKIKSSKFEVIYNGTDIFKFRKRNKKTKNLEIGMVANLTNKKDHPTFIKSIKLVAKKYPSISVLIIGKGELKDKLVKLTKELGLQKNIKFLGIRSDVPQILNKLDIGILLTQKEGEGMSNTLLEYMASGLPVVASKVPGNDEVVVYNKTGFLVEPYNPKKTADKIIKLLDNRELRDKMGKEGRKRVEEYFDDKTMIKKYEDLYLRLENKHLWFF